MTKNNTTKNFKKTQSQLCSNTYKKKTQKKTFQNGSIAGQFGHLQKKAPKNKAFQNGSIAAQFGHPQKKNKKKTFQNDSIAAVSGHS